MRALRLVLRVGRAAPLEIVGLVGVDALVPNILQVTMTDEQAGDLLRALAGVEGGRLAEVVGRGLASLLDEWLDRRPPRGRRKLVVGKRGNGV